MKLITTIVALLMPLGASAAVESSVGEYAYCVQWTRVNGVEHSKGFRFVLNEDQSMVFEVKYYTGTAKCEGEGESIMRSEKLTVLKTVGDFPEVLMMTLKDEDAGNYYELMFGGDSLLLEIGDSLPVEADFNKTVLLSKVK